MKEIPLALLIRGLDSSLLGSRVRVASVFLSAITAASNPRQCISSDLGGVVSGQAGLRFGETRLEAAGSIHPDSRDWIERAGNLRRSQQTCVNGGGGGPVSDDSPMPS